MTIRELNQYRYLKKEIANLKCRLEALTIADTVTGSAHCTPYQLRTTTITGHSKAGQKVQAQLRTAQERCAEELERLNNYINAIDDSQLRQIFRYRYIDGCSWVRTALYIGGGNTADGVRLKVSRYLEKN